MKLKNFPNWRDMARDRRASRVWVDEAALIPVEALRALRNRPIAPNVEVFATPGSAHKKALE